MGYVVPLGQTIYGGATVILNLLSPFPSFIEWLCGGDYVYILTMNSFVVYLWGFYFMI